MMIDLNEVEMNILLAAYRKQNVELTSTVNSKESVIQTLLTANKKYEIEFDKLSSQPTKSLEPSLTLSQISEVFAAFQSNNRNMNNKIAAIKKIREFTGVGLKEAKDVVDGFYPSFE